MDECFEHWSLLAPCSLSRMFYVSHHSQHPWQRFPLLLVTTIN